MANKLDDIRDWADRARQAHYRVARLAADCGVTPRRLKQYFRQKGRICPRRWLHSLRMEEARYRLLEGWSSKQVALQLDFTCSYFCRAFRQRFGQTPQDFVRRPVSIGPEPL
jgi:AraC-like DNA-binding protein